MRGRRSHEVMGFNKPRLAKIRPEAFVLSFGLLAAPASRLSLCVFLVASPIRAPPPRPRTHTPLEQCPLPPRGPVV